VKKQGKNISISSGTAYFFVLAVTFRQEMEMAQGLIFGSRKTHEKYN